MNFPAASTVLVFNVGESETSSALPRAPITVPKALPTPSTESSTELNDSNVKKKRIEQMLTEVDATAYQTLPAPKDSDVLLPDRALPSDFTYPTCNTEKAVPVNVHQNPNPLALQVGWNGEVPRWRPGSLIRWGAFSDGWPVSPQRRDEIISDFGQACIEWGSYNVGVSFLYEPDITKATFVVGYNGANVGNTWASAFFPNGNDLSYVNVYSGATFAHSSISLKPLFRHEVGHILGLRHEFSMDRSWGVENYEGGAVTFGPRDSNSVMKYKDYVITPTDIAQTKAFYAFTGGIIGGMQVKDYIPS